MSWFNFLFKPLFSDDSDAKTEKTFILEPILTPSAILEPLEDGQDFDVESQEDILENTESESNNHSIQNTSEDTLKSTQVLPEIPDEDLEEISFIYASEEEANGESEPEGTESTVTEDNFAAIADSEAESDHEITEESVDLTRAETELEGETDEKLAQLATDTDADGESPAQLLALEITEEVISEPKFDSGYFVVGETGEIEIDYLFDGGKYKGELSIFSLDGMEDYDPDTEDFIAEAAKRSNSNSELGHIVISDRTEGAHFSGELGEADHNSGEYLGVKTFNMRSGDSFAMMLVPKGRVEQVVDNPAIGGAARPLFSLATANPEDGFHMRQIADVTGEGNVFVFEDLRVDGKSDGDYNDLIFRVKGATGKADHIDDVIDSAKDWRNSDLGQELIDYVTGDESAVEEADNLALEDMPQTDTAVENNSDESKSGTDLTQTDVIENEDNSTSAVEDNRETESEENPAQTDVTENEDNSTSAAEDNRETESEANLTQANVAENEDNSTYVVEDNRESETQPIDLKTGEFIVGATGEVTVDFLFDGGGYKGEVAIFSLEGLEDLDPNSEEFRTEVLQRITDDSDLGQIIISDRTEGAKFTGELGEVDRNSGDYSGAKTLQMTPGEKFAVVLAPKGKIEWAVENPDRPLMFSLDSQQLADATGEGQTFAWEDLDVEKNSDKDYNDLIFRVKGAKGKADHIDELIDSENPWTRTPLGEAILDYGQPETLLVSPDKFYNPTDSIFVYGQVEDPDGLDDLDKVQIFLQKDGEEPIEVTDKVELTVDPDQPHQFEFTYTEEPLEPGHYELKILAQDRDGKVTEPTVERFTVLSVDEGDELSDRVRWAIEKATNLGNYEPEQLAGVQQWIVSVKNDEGSSELASQLGATDLGESGHIPHTHIWEFPEDLTAQEVAEKLGSEYKVEFTYPLVEYEVNWHSPANEPLVQSGEQWHLNQSGLAEVWENQDIQGRGVVIGVVDDGFEINDPTKGLQGHPDLLPNYREDLSYDFDEHDAYPSRTVDVDVHGQRGSVAPSQTNQFKLLSYAQGKIKNAHINLDLDHPNLQDLEVILVSPNAQEIPLTNITANGHSQALPQLQKEGADGLWTLKIKDPNNTNIWGSVNNWSLDFETYNLHGTLATGVAAASGDNNLGGSGVAPEAEWAGLRMGADGTTETEVARAISSHQDQIDIYNNSWGIGFFNPALASAEFELEQGIEFGRDGKGNIYVFAAGNGAEDGANVNYNSFANSRHTIAVAAIDHQGQHAEYSESGTPVFISAYSSDGDRTQNITTTGLYTPDGDDTNDYYPEFGGTSAAAPFVSGVVALMLEANANLTWRDVQHILAATAIKNDPNDPGWHQNQGGYWVNDKYGFGQVNPKGAVELAKTWQPVAKEEPPISWKKSIPNPLIPEFDPNNPQSLTSTIKISPEEDLQLEWVEIEFNGNHRYLGELEIVLEHIDSQGNKTESVLARPHEEDKYEFDKNNQYKWAFTSTHHWGEMAEGEWNLRVRDTVKRNSTRHIPPIPGKRNIWQDWTLTLHGTRPNTAPIVTNLDQEHQYTEDTPLSLLPMVITDPDGDTMTVTLELSNPEAGKLVSGEIESNAEGVWTVTGSVTEVNQKLANLQFIPAENFNGEVQISTAVTDGKLSWPLMGEINLIGMAENDPPTLQPVQLNGAVVDEAFEVDVAQLLAGLNPEDGDGDPISFKILPPSSGTLTLNGVAVTTETAMSGTDTLIWTPNTAGDSVEAFQVIGNDGQENSAPIPVTVSVTEVPLPPVDLVAQNLFMFQQTANPGDTVNVGYMLQNMETGSAEEFPIHFYLSKDGEVTTSDYLLGSVLIQNGLTGFNGTGGFTSLSLPNVADRFWKGDGTYTIGMMVDPDNSVFETEEENNTSLFAIQIENTNTPPQLNSVIRLPGGIKDQPFTITYERLLSTSNAQDLDRDEISFIISDPSNGVLRKDGIIINPGETMILKPGESLEWTSDNDGDEITAFKVRATDGQLQSDILAELRVQMGDNFKIGSQAHYPSVTGLNDGGFVLTWNYTTHDGIVEIYGQRYDQEGFPVGQEFQVTSPNEYRHWYPSMAGLTDGGFVVTWHSTTSNGVGPDGSGDGVYAQRYDHNGIPVGEDFQVNSYTYSTQNDPSIAALTDGGFVITWQSNDVDNYGVYGQRYDRNGVPMGEEFQVNSYTPHMQWESSVTGLTDGGFVVVWQSDIEDGIPNNDEIRGQRYDQNSLPIGEEFSINSYTENNQKEAVVTGLNDGGFVVIWQSEHQDGNGWEIYGQRYDKNGLPVDEEFRVNSETESDQIKPSVTAFANGGFVVNWTVDKIGTSSLKKVYSKRYNQNGNSDPEILVSSFNGHNSPISATGHLADGRYVVVWDSSTWDQENGLQHKINGRILGIKQENILPNPNETQQVIWSKRVGISGYDRVSGISTDSEGNVYVTGSFRESIDLDGDGTDDFTSAGYDDAYIAKYSSNGTFVWAKGFGNSSFDLGQDISTDSEGNVYTTGYFRESIDLNGDGTADFTSAGGSDVYIAKYSTDGTLAWAKGFGGGNGDRGHSISTDSVGNVYATGEFFGSIDLNGDGTADLTSTGVNDAYIAKYSSNGTLAWATQVGSRRGDSGNGISTDSAGNVYVTGMFAGSIDLNGDGIADLTVGQIDDAYDEAYIAKYSSNGTLAWAKGFGGGSVDLGKDISIDSAGNVYAIGEFTGSMDFNGDGTVDLTSAGGRDVYIAKYNSDGTLAWGKGIGSSWSDHARGISTDSEGNIYVTGSFRDSIDLDADGTADLTNAGDVDAYIAKYSTDGTLAWAKGVGSSRSDGGSAISTDSEGNVYATGNFSGSMDLDGDGTVDLTGAGNHNGYIIKLGEKEAD